jgi:hypothetical protein
MGTCEFAQGRNPYDCVHALDGRKLAEHLQHYDYGNEPLELFQERYERQSRCSFLPRIMHSPIALFLIAYASSVQAV